MSGRVVAAPGNLGELDAILVVRPVGGMTLGSINLGRWKWLRSCIDIQTTSRSESSELTSASSLFDSIVYLVKTRAIFGGEARACDTQIGAERSERYPYPALNTPPGETTPTWREGLDIPEVGAGH